MNVSYLTKLFSRRKDDTILIVSRKNPFNLLLRRRNAHHISSRFQMKITPHRQDMLWSSVGSVFNRPSTVVLWLFTSLMLGHSLVGLEVLSFQDYSEGKVVCNTFLGILSSDTYTYMYRVEAFKKAAQFSGGSYSIVFQIFLFT